MAARPSMTFSARACRSASGTTSLTICWFSACSAVSLMPVRAMYLAALAPTTQGSPNHIMPPPHSWISGTPIRASSAQMVRSHASIRSNAPPTQAPCTWATTGLREDQMLWNVEIVSAIRACTAAGSFERFAPPDRAEPAQKAGPRPLSRVAATAGSSSDCPTSSPILTAISWDMALRFSGRLSVIAAQPSATEYSMWFSLIWLLRELVADPPQVRRDRDGRVLREGAVQLRADDRDLVRRRRVPEHGQLGPREVLGGVVRAQAARVLALLEERVKGRRAVSAVVALRSGAEEDARV